MKRQATSVLRFALTIALAVGIMLSSNAQSELQEFAEVAELLAEHQAEIEDHGHSHDDIVDILHIFQGHAHEMADHDHNTAFLPPRRSAGIIAPSNANWSLTETAASDRSAYDLDRPPRV
jgi:ABC-type Zn2+ transport system substrate-binding protein/surface adhesin